MKTRSIKSTWNISVRIPMVPNFLFENTTLNLSDEGKYPISDFPDDVLKEVGKAWIENLLNRAKEMRELRKNK